MSRKRCDGMMLFVFVELNVMQTSLACEHIWLRELSVVLENQDNERVLFVHGNENMSEILYYCNLETSDVD